MISGVPFVNNKNVADLAVKVMSNVDSQLSSNDILESARRLINKDKNDSVIHGPNLVRFKNIKTRDDVIKNKKNILKA